MADIKEKVICPWCKEKMRPYPHQGYYWFQCKCGARTPTLWHATEEQTRKRALSYTADVVPKSEVERLKVEGGILEQECGKLMGRVASLEIDLEAMRSAANSYKMHYENLAREIFEEIEKIRFKEIHKCETLRKRENEVLRRKYWEGGYNSLRQLSYWLAELKKKYLPKECPTCKHFVGCEQACGGSPCEEHTEVSENAKRHS